MSLLFQQGKVSSDSMWTEVCGSVTCDSVSVNINSLHVLRIKYELLEFGGEISNQLGQHEIFTQLV